MKHLIILVSILVLATSLQAQEPRSDHEPEAQSEIHHLLTELSNAKTEADREKVREKMKKLAVRVGPAPAGIDLPLPPANPPRLTLGEMPSGRFFEAPMRQRTPMPTPTPNVSVEGNLRGVEVGLFELMIDTRNGKLTAPEQMERIKKLLATAEGLHKAMVDKGCLPKPGVPRGTGTPTPAPLTPPNSELDH